MENASEDSDNYDDFDDFSEEDDTYSGFGVSSYDRPSFKEANFKYAKSMSISQYKSEIESHIKSLPLTARYKKSLISCIYAILSEEQVLANNYPRYNSKLIKNDPLDRVLVFAQRNVELTRCSATKYDLNVCNTFEIEKNILDVFEKYVSRSVGDKRERLINAELGTRNITQSEVVPQKNLDQDNEKRRRSLFSRWK